MADDVAVLWRDRDGGDELLCEIVQIAEGEFELRLLRNGHLFLSSDSGDYGDLLDEAVVLRTETRKLAAQARR